MNAAAELGTFMLQNKLAGGLPVEISDHVKALWNEYKQPKLADNCAIISADFGSLGSLVIRYIATCGEDTLKYEPGSYDYISIRSRGTKRILWTDYANEEPYNRHGGLYCDGASFDTLGEPVKKTDDYREFQNEQEYTHSICFGVWGFDYNDFYGSVRFGMCIKKEKVEEFVSRLRDIIGK